MTSGKRIAESPRTTGSDRTPHVRLARQKVQYRLLLQLLAELEGNELTVGIVPCRQRRECGIRVALSKNATWYRKLCAAHPSSRVRRNAAFDTRIRRKRVIEVLKTLIRTGQSRGKYVPWILRHIALDMVKVPNPF